MEAYHGPRAGGGWLGERHTVLHCNAHLIWFLFRVPSLSLLSNVVVNNDNFQISADFYVWV